MGASFIHPWHMMGYGSVFGSGWGSSPFYWSPLFLILAVWSLFWKGLALWHAAKRNEKWWFLACLVFSTAGILEIIYLFAVAKLKSDQLFRDWTKK